MMLRRIASAARSFHPGFSTWARLAAAATCLAAAPLAARGDDAASAAAAPNSAGSAASKPRLVRAHFADGTILIGQMLLDELQVETSFGTLTVPRTQVESVVPGLDTRAELDERLDRLVGALRDAQFAEREAAEKELLLLGPAVVGELKRRATEVGGDHGRRIRSVIGKIKEADDFDAWQDSQPKTWIRKDRVRTAKFTIVGDIVAQQLTFKSRYGQVGVPLADIVAIERPSHDKYEDVAATLSLTGQNFAQFAMKKTGVTVRAGDRVIVRASGMIRRTAGTNIYVSSPDGSSRFGTHPGNASILGGTLIARIGKSGEFIKIGSNASFTAKQTGKLEFGIGMRADYVGRYPFPGEYTVQLRVRRGE